MKPYVVDDTFTISEEIKRMSDEERHKLARKLEEEGRREKEKIIASGKLKTLHEI